MGYKPDQITYASDHFDKLIEFALQLIKKGQAYVSEASSEDMHN